MGARFAKWRAVIRVTEALPSSACVSANTHALGRYAALCQEQGLVPIVEPEVLMDGSHTIERSEEVTGNILQAVFRALFEQCVALEAMLPGNRTVTRGRRRHRAVCAWTRPARVGGALDWAASGRRSTLSAGYGHRVCAGLLRRNTGCTDLERASPRLDRTRGGCALSPWITRERFMRQPKSKRINATSMTPSFLISTVS